MFKKSNFKYLAYALVFLSLIISCDSKGSLESATDLTISEGFKNPIGFYDANPTFSWKLPVSESNKSQSAYHIVAASKPDLLPDNADLWDSEKQTSEQSTWITYGGKPLESRQKVYWQVKYWNQNGDSSKWSETNHFELGLLNNSDWKAKWIGLDTAKDSIRGRENVIIHKPQYLRKGFELSSDVTSARLYITSKGVFDVSINGENVSDDAMSPGFTTYDKRIETLTYDVTNLIESGQNTIGVELASGWHSGRLLWGTTPWDNTISPKVLAQLEMTMSDGSKEIIVSDVSWKGMTNGPLQFAEIYDGEIYNANLEMPNWTTNNFDDKNWTTVEVGAIDANVKLEPKRHTTVKDKIKLVPQDITSNDGVAVFDLKQNMVGVPLVNVPMKKGDTLKIRFAEMLSPDGTFYTKNYRSAHSTDYYIAAKDGDIEYQPKFTFHGFRFVELSGFDTSETPTKDWVTGIVQYSDFEDNGTFTSSHDKLNQLQSNIVWGLRGNFLDIPTDCPQRNERLGWTGDAQVFGPTSMFNADVYKFWASWLQSVREAQLDDGAIPWTVPDSRGNKIGSSGWGDVGTIIPWKIYMRTGDVGFLEDNFEMMKNWVGYHQKKSNKHISNMMSFSDWLQPFPENGDTRGDTSSKLIGTAFYAHSAKLTAKVAKTLGKTEEQAKYEELYKTVAKAFENKFFDETGKVKEVAETQTSYLLALAFDLLSDDKKANAKKFLLKKIAEADNHLRTGFLGTPLLSEVLDETGEIDLMYKLLFNETYPSWFYSINQGATTIWERWNSYSKEEGFNPMNMNSLNHYAYGAIGQWMYERIAGIAPLEAGYKIIKIAPQPNEPLTSASASLSTPYGKVSSSWKIKDGKFFLEVVIPPNTTAKVIIPADRSEVLEMDGKTFEDNSNMKLINTGKDVFELEVQPGTYTFKSKLK
ncbi:family 78 glycoside hydrolase catalytic domain [Winogradskyella litoriviva]|uniref:alpha-L-rhamnosidase n=1 Tax=Winogradskyella litoriviva TaxID=1220182 RepID=A0ABX2E3H7_9FLAO|nr:family 78 glycoside hydrolase catalytic domain [Winogradskyella litoriviva]NRD23045.1 family 78 glycoside hydrolase catalytic domain [Winogradskyella litoriviva]